MKVPWKDTEEGKKYYREYMSRWNKENYRNNPEYQRLRARKYYRENSEQCKSKAKERRRRQREENPKLNWARSALYDARQRAKRKGLAFELKPEDLICPNVCPVLGVSLDYRFDKKRAFDNSPSVDRISSKHGYVKTNVQVISKRANTLKSDGTLEEFKALVRHLETFR